MENRAYTATRLRLGSGVTIGMSVMGRSDADFLFVLFMGSNLFLSVPDENVLSDSAMERCDYAAN